MTCKEVHFEASGHAGSPHGALEIIILLYLTPVPHHLTLPCLALPCLA